MTARPMSDKEKDKRLLLPHDDFEEEASEGLGKLNREEAAEDLRELKGRMERRLRKPRMIWLPAAAAVVILLVASTVYIALFRDRNMAETEIAITAGPITDTAVIAMAEPIIITKAKSVIYDAPNETTPGPTPRLDIGKLETKDELAEAEKAHEFIAADDEIAVVEVMEEQEVAEEVIVEAMPMMERAAVSEKKERAADAAGAPSNLAASTPDKQATPVGGMEEFNKWINRNIRYPAEVMPRERQVVVITFKVMADSTIYDMKAERMVGEPFTNEAFRLLREGPRWVPTVRNGTVSLEEVRVSILFK